MTTNPYFAYESIEDYEAGEYPQIDHLRNLIDTLGHAHDEASTWVEWVLRSIDADDAKRLQGLLGEMFDSIAQVEHEAKIILANAQREAAENLASWKLGA